MLFQGHVIYNDLNIYLAVSNLVSSSSELF